MAKPRACRSTIKLPAPVAVDAAALARRKTISRLRRAKQGLEAFKFRLESMHADKTGCVRMYFGAAMPHLAYEERAKLQGIARTKREASNGCPLCAAWLEETADIREQIEELRNTPWPLKDPSYTGWPLTMGQVNRIGVAQVVGVIRAKPDVPALLAEQEARRAERRARGASLLQDFQQELAEAAEAKAAANVPH